MFGLYVYEATASPTGSAAAVVVSSACAAPSSTYWHSMSSAVGSPVHPIADVSDIVAMLVAHGCATADGANAPSAITPIANESPAIPFRRIRLPPPSGLRDEYQLVCAVPSG